MHHHVINTESKNNKEYMNLNENQIVTRHELQKVRNLK